MVEIMELIQVTATEILKVIGALLLVAGAWLINRRLNNKEVTTLKRKLMEIEVKQKNQATEDDKAKNWLGFVREQIGFSTKAITSVFETKTGVIVKEINNRLDEGDKRFDKIESNIRQIGNKIPMYKEPNGHKKVLLIEDDLMNADLITVFLEELDVFVVRVNNSHNAILKVNQYYKKPFDLAIADKRLKGDLADVFIDHCINNSLLIDGNNKLKIILYSGCEDVKNNKWGLEYLEKPFNREHLQEKVKVYL